MSVATLSLFLSAAAISGFFTLQGAKGVFSRLRPAGVLLVGGGLVTLSFFLLGFCGHPFLWCLPAIPFGCGTVLVVNLLGPTVVHQLLREHVGVALGVMTTIASLVGAVIHPLLVWFVKGVGWRRACFLLGGISFLLVVLFWWLFRLAFPREQHRAEPQKDLDLGTPWNLAGKSLLVFMAVITAFNMFHQHFATYAKIHHIEATPLSVALSLSMIGAAVGGILIGRIGDRYGGGYGGLFTLAIGGASCILFLTTRGVWGFCVAATLHGIASSGIGVTVPALAREFFRGRDYTYVLSRVMLGAPISTIISMPLYGILYDRLGSYRLSLIQLLLCLFFSALMLLFAMKRGKSKV